MNALRVFLVFLFIPGFFLGAVEMQEVTDTLNQERPENSYNKLEFEIRLMPSFSSFALRTYSGSSVSVHTGQSFACLFAVAYYFTKHVGVEMGVGYNSFSGNYQDGYMERRINLKYLNIPLLASFSTNRSLPVNFNVVVGPQIGFDAGSNAQLMDDRQVDSLRGVFALKKTDLGLAYGAGLDFSFSEQQTLHIGIGFRGVYGLMHVNNDRKQLEEGAYYILDDKNIETYAGYLVLRYGF